jgi:hypothetical protein
MGLPKNNALSRILQMTRELQEELQEELERESARRRDESADARGYIARLEESRGGVRRSISDASSSPAPSA